MYGTALEKSPVELVKVVKSTQQQKFLREVYNTKKKLLYQINALLFNLNK